MKVLPITLVLGAVVGALTPPVLAAAADGERIEFSTPKEKGPVRPLTGSETGDRRLNFERRESGAVESQLPAGSVLPAPDDVNRTRLLLRLIERSAGRGGGDDLNGSGLSLGDAADGNLGATDFGGIDDILDRASSRREGRDSSGERSDGLGDSRRDRAPTVGRDVGSASAFGAQDNRSGIESSGGVGERGEAAFLPGMEPPSLLGEDTSRRDVRFDNMFDTSRSGRGGAMMGRDREAALRYRAERLEVRQRLLGISPGGMAGSGAASADPRLGFGQNPPAAGLAGMSGARSLGALPSSAPKGPGGGSELGALDQSMALPGASSVFDLGLGTGRGASVFDRSTPAGLPAPKPMELFQRKHDSRIPMRGF